MHRRSRRPVLVVASVLALLGSVGVDAADAAMVLVPRSQSALLTLDDTLPSPTNVCGESRLGAVELRWDLQWDDTVTGHVVQYREVDGAGAAVGEWTDGPPVTDPSSVSVPGTNGVNYEYRVAAMGAGDTRSDWGSNCMKNWGTRITVADSSQMGSASGTLPRVDGLGVAARYRFKQLVAASDLSCGLTTDGQVACWGRNDRGLIGVGDPFNTSLARRSPTLVTGGALAGKKVVAIDAGDDHVCALTTEGTIACWGFLTVAGIQSAPALLDRPGFSGTTFSAIAVAGSGLCAVSNTGLVLCIGGSYGGEATEISGGALEGQTVIAIAGSSQSPTFCAVTTTGVLACWGYNAFGQLGIGTKSEDEPVPVAVTGGALAGKTVASVSVGLYHTCAVATDGSLACWGSNANGEVGDGTDQTRTLPVAVDGGALSGKTVVGVTAGSINTCARVSDGSLACWGANSSLQVGPHTEGYLPYLLPFEVTRGVLAGASISQVAVGGQHVCAATDSGRLACWGNNYLGATGVRTGLDSLVREPTWVYDGALAGETIADVAASGSSRCALTASGKVACWGYNQSGSLGDVYTGITDTALPIDQGPMASAVITQITPTCALSDVGTVMCWGDPAQRGNGGEVAPGDEWVNPVEVTGGALVGKTVVQIAGNSQYNCALTSAGKVACWGSNGSGQLGDGTTDAALTPVAVSGGALSGQIVTQIAVGDEHTCALTAAGKVVCWGWNAAGQLGRETYFFIQPTPLDVTGGALTGQTVTQITVGRSHSCALTQTGYVACWGDNRSGQLGTPTPEETSPTPVAVSGGLLDDVEVVRVSAGHDVSCALDSQQHSYCWGSNENGGLGDGSTISRSTPIRSGVAAGGASWLRTEAGLTTMRWSGVAAPGAVPVAPTNVVTEVDGSSVTVSWRAPVWSGSAPLTGYVVERSSDAGATWNEAATVGNVRSTEVVVPRDDYWMFAVRAVSSAGVSPRSEPSDEVRVSTEVRVTKSNVSVTFLTPASDPIVGATVSWRTPDNVLRSMKTSVTDGTGTTLLPIVATGPVVFSFEGGRVGTSATLVSSATITGVVQRSGASLTLRTPPAPTVVERSVDVTMPDDSPVPDTRLTVHGGAVGATTTKRITDLRTISVDWTYEGFDTTPVTDANGRFGFSGFRVPTIGADVSAEFEDNYVLQRAAGSLRNPAVSLVFEQMPVVRVISPDPGAVLPGQAVEITVEAVDGTGDPIVGAALGLEATEAPAGGPAAARQMKSQRIIHSLFGAAAVEDSTPGPSGHLAGVESMRVRPMAGCSQRLVGTTGETGRVTLRLCASLSGQWQADGPNIVASRPIDITVLREKPVAVPKNAKATLSWKAPAWIDVPSINGYVVQASLNGGVWRNVGSTRGATSLTVGRLRNGGTYRFRIAAKNARARGVWLETDPVVPRGLPSAPRSLVLVADAASVNISWVAPASDGGAGITDYRIQISTNGRTWSTVPDGVSASTLFTLTGLTNGTRYFVRVAAVNAAGSGPNSAVKSATPKI